MLDCRYLARSREDGFTLVEMVLVVAIIGILVSIATATYAFALANSRSIACHSNQRILTDAATVYTAEHGSPPDELEDLAVYAGRWERITHCPSDSSVVLEWDPVTEQVNCELHPSD